MKRRASLTEFVFCPEDECRRLAFEYFNVERTRGKQFGNAGLAVDLFDELRSAYRCEVVLGVSDRVLRPEYYPNYSVSPSIAKVDSDKIQQTQVCLNDNHDASSVPYIVEIKLEGRVSQSVSGVDDFANAVGLVSCTNSMGTGFIVSIVERLVLTASHVIEGNREIAFYMKRGETATKAKVIWNNPKVDLAILQCNSLPPDARFFRLDSNISDNPKVTERIMHCGFPKGTEVSTNFFTYQGVISNYDPDKQLGDRCFDAILSSIEATHGCSGGPVIRESDFSVIGVLQGGFNDAPARIIIDTHQLFNQETLKVNGYAIER